MTRKGAFAINNGIPSNFNTIDDLSYFYAGNRLARVEDNIKDNLDVGDFKNSNPNTTDYSYWQDGSLKSDLNKGISLIDYDAFLQKPKQINFSDGRRINFYYDSKGLKLKQTTSTGKEIHYSSKAIYERKNSVTLLYQISQAEGRELPLANGFEQEYEYRDWLGNLRVSFKDATVGTPSIRNAPTIVQTIDYDPWGLELNGIGYENSPAPSKFRFSGKESILDFSLGWIDFGARMQDKQLGRWSAIDPLAEKMLSWSSYVYAFNNPIKYIDYNGLIPIPVNKLFKGMSYRIDSWFGPRNTGIKGASKNHKGLDINFGYGQADKGAPVLTTHDGIAKIDNDPSGKEGRMVTITSPDGKFRTKYLHLSKINIGNNEKVNEASQIGEIGGSGYGSEIGQQTHLHYAIEKFNDETDKFEPYNPTEGKDKKESNIIDPQKWIKIKKVGFPMLQESTMEADATRVNLYQIFINIGNLKAGSYKIVDGKIVPL